MYSLADSTVAALLLLLLAVASSFDSLLSPLVWASGLPSLLLLSLPSFGVADLGRSDCISLSASLIRLRRPCSATLCDVRFDVKPVDKCSGYDTPGSWLPSRRFW